MTPYYPNVQIIDTPQEVGLRTVLRKEHEGVWYLWPVVRTWSPKEGLSSFEQINRFHREVYHALILGKYTASIGADGNPFFQEATNQQSEYQRLLDSNNSSFEYTSQSLPQIQVRTKMK
jgi:hypothetical protein